MFARALRFADNPITREIMRLEMLTTSGTAKRNRERVKAAQDREARSIRIFSEILNRGANAA